MPRKVYRALRRVAIFCFILEVGCEAGERRSLGGVRLRFSCSWHTVLALGLVATFVSACSLDPNLRKQNYFQSGESYFEKGKYSESAIEFANAIKIDPDYADAHFQLAESYLNLRQPDRALPEFERTVELRPDYFRARLAMANLLTTSRNFMGAQEQTDWLLKRRPNDPASHAAASSLLAAENRVADAIRETQQTIALAPSQWEFHLGLGLLQLKDNQPDAAEASFKKVMEMDPKAVQARLLLGSFYESANRLTEAEQQFTDAIALDPHTVSPREALARLYLAEGKKNEAEQILQQAVRDLPESADCYLALSNFYFVTGNLDRAVAEYTALYQRHSNDIQIKKKYIQLLIQTTHYEQAGRLNDEILKSSPNDGDALVFRSQMQISQGDVNDAEQTLETVIHNAPDDSLAHYALGVAYQKQGFMDRAENQWRTALRLNPDLLDAERAIADAAMLKGDMVSLQDATNQMIRLEPGSPDGYALRALCSINRKQYDEAERDIRRAIAVAPQSAAGYVQTGNLRYAEMQYAEAATAYQTALDKNVNSTDALRGLMNSYIAQKQVDKAIAVAEAQIAKSPASSGSFSLLGSVLFYYKSDLSGAETALRKAVALDAHNVSASLRLCQVLAAKGEIDQAIVSNQQAIKDNPRYAELYLQLGNLLESRLNWKGAESAFQNALAIDSQDPVASNELARAMLHAGGDSDVALSLAQTALRGLPKSPAVSDTLGWIYYQKGAFALANNYLEQALRLEEQNHLPDNPDIRYHLGMAYVKTRRLALAKEQFERVLKTNPDYQGAAEIKQELIGLKS